MPSSNPKSINYGAKAGESFPGEDGAAQRKQAIDEAVKASTGNAGKEQGDKAKAALK